MDTATTLVASTGRASTTAFSSKRVQTVEPRGLFDPPSPTTTVRTLCGNLSSSTRYQSRRSGQGVTPRHPEHALAERRNRNKPQCSTSPTPGKDPEPTLTRHVSAPRSSSMPRILSSGRALTVVCLGPPASLRSRALLEAGMECHNAHRSTRNRKSGRTRSEHPDRALHPQDGPVRLRAFGRKPAVGAGSLCR